MTRRKILFCFDANELENRIYKTRTSVGEEEKNASESNYYKEFKHHH
jgi:hypothetical protein